MVLNKHKVTCVGGLELVDDGGLAAVVQAQAQDVHLLPLQTQPPGQLVKQPHRSASTRHDPILAPAQQGMFNSPHHTIIVILWPHKCVAYFTSKGHIIVHVVIWVVH